jgi:DNA adenine methylase
MTPLVDTRPAPGGGLVRGDAMTNTTESLQMPISALAPWFGSKRNLAETIVEELGEHRVYWEPFCGSLAVLLAKPVVVMETANDLHGDLVNLARVLKAEDTALDLYARLARLVFHEDLFREAAERYKARGNIEAGEVPEVDRAEDFMICSWFGRNGVAGTESYNQGFCVRYTANGGHAATRWLGVVDSIPAWHQRLRHVTILNRDAFAMLERVRDEAGTSIYCDPPYLTKGARYIHDFDGPDHRRLAEALRRFRHARVVVSYYDDPRLEGLYPGWQRRRIDVTKSLANQNRRDQEGSISAVEVLLVNGDRARGRERHGNLFDAMEATP